MNIRGKWAEGTKVRQNRNFYLKIEMGNQKGYVEDI